MYTPKTGQRCGCKRGVQRDNCSNCEGTGQVIDFAAIHARRRARMELPPCARAMGCLCAAHAKGRPASGECDAREDVQP